MVTLACPGRMSQGTIWTSSEHYQTVFNSFVQPLTMASAPASLQTYLMASGLVYSDGQVELDPLWPVERDSAYMRPPAAGSYCVETRGAAGESLDSACFDPAFVNNETRMPTEVSAFTVFLPHSPGITTLILKHDGDELGRWSPSSKAPTLEILSPVANGMCQ